MEFEVLVTVNIATVAAVGHPVNVFSMVIPDTVGGLLNLQSDSGS